MKKTASSHISDMLNAYIERSVVDYQEQYDEITEILSSLGEEIDKGDGYGRYRFHDESTIMFYAPFIMEESDTMFFSGDKLPEFLKDINGRDRIPFMEGVAARVQRQATCTRYSFEDLPPVLVYPSIWSVDLSRFEDD